MKMEKDSVVFYKVWRDAVAGFPAEVRLQIYEAAMTYAYDGVEPVLDGAAAMAFAFIRQQIDADYIKYLNICNRNKDNGKSGGRPRTHSVKNNPENPVGFDKPKKADKEKDKDKDKDNVITTINCGGNNIITTTTKIECKDIPDYIIGLTGTNQFVELQRAIYELDGNKMPDNARMRELLEKFRGTCVINGDEKHDKNDLCRHFISWARVAIPNEKKRQPKQEQRFSRLRSDEGIVYTDF